MKSKNKIKAINPKLWLYFCIAFMFSLLSVIFFSAIVISILYFFGIFSNSNADRSFFLPLLLMVIISILLGLIVSIFIGKVFLKPLEELNKGLHEVAKGNFAIRVEEESSLKEVNDMLKNFNSMAEALSSIETLRTDFVANVSHEFKTQLAAIEGYATLLQSENLSKEKHDEYINKLINNTHKLSTLTGNILQLSKLENQNSSNLEKEKFNLSEQLRQAILSLESKWESKNINFDLNFDEIYYYGDSGLINHIWTNIISNAIKFSPENSTIVLEASENTKEIVVKIKDHGCGIAKENINKIFDKFYQVDTTHHSEGNGLGLALVWRIIKIINASIEVESELNCGSTFTIHLPK